MSDIAIRVENLSKLYKIGRRQNDYRTLRESLASAFSAPLRWVKNPKSQSQNPNSDYIWALKDVSLEIKRGEVVGIVGRNGAGKSTLLKILSRITEPTEGYAEIHGRVGSLLEVGTGFHPELTGRENIYLNGIILGMKKAEIERNFDEIVAFAEVEKFIDTPVKHYSSGMYVRLAFAVAAHLEPEILVVDEVLAVGDADFQRKCLGKMRNVAREGRTLLFVSHNMAAVKGLCHSAFLLDDGKSSLKGDVDNVVNEYLRRISTPAEGKRNWVYRHHGTLISIDEVELKADGLPAESVQSGCPWSIRIYYHALIPQALQSELSVSIMLFSEGQKLVNLWTNYQTGRGVNIWPRGIIECSINKWPFRSQLIRVDIYTHIGQDVQEWLEECLLFDSFDSDYYQSGIISRSGQGIMFVDHEWNSYANE